MSTSTFRYLLNISTYSVKWRIDADPSVSYVYCVLVEKIASQNYIYHQQVYYIDATEGTILFDFNKLCKLHHDHSTHDHDTPVTALPPEIGFGQDLNNVNRQVQSYSQGNAYYMIDASRPMFNASGSEFPWDPKGAIWTLDADNTTPIENDDFQVKQVTSFNNQDWPAGAVSAHYNAGVAFEYFRNTFQRNSIDGQGGTIISIINTADEDGSGLDNAFWTGTAMFYGNGKNAFILAPSGKT